MKGELMPGFTCTAEDSATTETTGCSKRICNADLERKDGTQRDFEPFLGDRRVRSKLQDSELSADSVRKKDVSRTIRPSGGKDRHSKVNTSKGPRDRRVRLSVSTAIQFYDVQDRLGYDQPSKAVEWLIKKAKIAIDELPPLPTQIVHSSNQYNVPSVLSPSRSSTVPFSAVQGVAGPLLTSVIQASEPAAMDDASLLGLKSFLATSGVGTSGNESRVAPTQQSTLRSGSFGTGTAYPSQADSARMYTTSEFPKPLDAQAGPPSARIELRTKARERARERAKEKSSVKEPAKASCSAAIPPSSAMHAPLSQHISFTGSPDQQNILKSSPHDHTQEFQPQPSLENQMQSSFKDILRNFVNNATPEHMQTLSLQVPRQTAANSHLFSPSTALPQETAIQGFHQKPQMLPSFLNQVPLQGWSQTTADYSHGLHCSSRGSLYPSSFLHNNMAFCHNNSPLSVSCSSAISQLAVIGVPYISNFTGAIMPSDRVPTPSMISMDPCHSAFRPTTQLPASHQERALLDYLSFQRLSGAQLSSYGLKPSDILLNSQANGLAQLASASAFEPCNNQFHRMPSSRTSSDLQVYDHGAVGIKNSESLQSDQGLPARLRGLDEIEEQLKRSSSSYQVVHPSHD